MNLYILMIICNKHYSFPSTVSLTAGLMCFKHFKMSINLQGMPQMYFLLTGNLPCLLRVRRKQQIKERPDKHTNKHTHISLIRVPTYHVCGHSKRGLEIKK